MGRYWIVVRWSFAALSHALEKHRVTEQEIVEAFSRGVLLRELEDNRLAAYSETASGRLLTAFIEVRGGENWLLTARKMEPRERIYYVTREGHGDDEA